MPNVLVGSVTTAATLPQLRNLEKAIGEKTPHPESFIYLLRGWPGLYMAWSSRTCLSLRPNLLLLASSVLYFKIVLPRIARRRQVSTAAPAGHDSPSEDFFNTFRFIPLS